MREATRTKANRSALLSKTTMDILHDDAVKCIGQYTGILYGAESYVYFASTCKRMRKLLLPALETDNKIIDTIISIRVADWIKKRYNLGVFFPSRVNTLEQLAILETWLVETNFISDNRIKFPFASTEVEPDMSERITQISNLMKRYPNIRLRLDAPLHHLTESLMNFHNYEEWQYMITGI